MPSACRHRLRSGLIHAIGERHGVRGLVARRAGISRFLDAILEFGSGRWTDFYRLAAQRSEIAIERPFYPARPGGTSQSDLAVALGVRLDIDAVIPAGSKEDGVSYRRRGPLTLSNNDLLTEPEFSSFTPHPLIMEHLERSRASLGVPRRDFRIVDWGCGRGALVLWLREHGYDVVGVDIDQTALQKGAALFESRGHLVEDCLRVLDPLGRAPFPDASFHFVTSYQVVEHIEDLDAASAEWARLTADGGAGLHIYPPHLRPIEPHLFMPFVHWLPKNAARKWLIGLFVLAGVEPHWWPNQTKSWKEKQRVYYHYSAGETFYRRPAAIRDVLAAQGLQSQFVDAEPSRWNRKLAARLGLSPASKVVSAWYLNYSADVGLATSRPRRGERISSASV